MEEEKRTDKKEENKPEPSFFGVSYMITFKELVYGTTGNLIEKVIEVYMRHDESFIFETRLLQGKMVKITYMDDIEGYISLFINPEYIIKILKKE